MSIRLLQDKLIQTAEQQYSKNPLSHTVKTAFYEIPRHKFIRRYRNWSSYSKKPNNDWVDLNEDNLDEHLPLLYADHPLIIFGESKDFEQPSGNRFVSTISQPSLVLRLIDILKLEKGHKVFELGGGSGWNAALMGQVVGPKGKVTSIEIIPELVGWANASISALKLDNVVIVNGDGMDGCKEDAPFDRGIFTAGSYDLPKAFFEQIKVGGLLLFVLKHKGGGDNLILLERKPDCFESIYSMPCGFVAVTGRYHDKDMEEIPLGELIEKSGLKGEITACKDFWWSSSGEESFFWSTIGLKSFLTISNKNFTSVLIDKGKKTFALWDKENQSLAVAHHNRIDSYGSDMALKTLINEIKLWIDLGMPSGSNLKLRVYPKGTQIPHSNKGWIVQRKDSIFSWSLSLSLSRPIR